MGNNAWIMAMSAIATVQGYGQHKSKTINEGKHAIIKLTQ